MKFKKGNKVVFAKDDTNSKHRSMLLNKTYTIGKAYTDSTFNGNCYLIEEDNTYFYEESELESEELYNSPLYQALK